MAKKWKPHGSRIPVFNPADRYSYFNDLLVDTDYPLIDRQKKALYRNAAAYFSFLKDITAEKEDPSEFITSAIEFLGQAAENERGKEIRAIELYVKDLEERIPTSLRQQGTFIDIINRLKSVSSSITSNSTSMNSKDLNDFYVELTTYINMIKQDIVDFQARIHQIANDLKDDKGMRAEFAGIRIKSDLDTLFKSISGQQKRQTASSFSSRVRNLATDFLIEYMKKNASIDFSENFSAILAGLIIDFEYAVQHQRNLTQDYQLALDKIKKEEVKKMFDDYIEKSDTVFLKRLNNYTNNINTIEFERSLKRFKSALGISFLNEYSDEAQKQLQAIKKQEELMKKNNLNGRNYVARALQNSGFEQIAQASQLITWTFNTRTGHGNVYEGIHEILQKSFTVGTKGGATDAITLGEINGAVNTEYIEELMDSSFSMMADSIGDMLINDRMDRLHDWSYQIKEANNTFNFMQEDLAKTIAKLENIKIEDIFIFHESLKLYSSIEVNEKGQRRTTKFHGREMQVFSALDNLFALDDLGVVQLPDKNALYGIVLNLADGAVAHSQLPVVENYLSIFAGLLMFSDVRDMASELAQQAVKGISYGNPTKVHLYLLNDTYVPGSMILTYIYNTIKEGYSHINVRDGARVSISTDAADKVIADYLSNRKEGLRDYNIEDWPENADAIMHGVKMQINFLSSYVSFIKKIANII